MKVRDFRYSFLKLLKNYNQYIKILNDAETIVNKDLLTMKSYYL